MQIKQRMTIMSAVLAALTLGVGGAVGIPSIFAIKKTVALISEAQQKLDERYALRRYLSKASIDITEKKGKAGPLADAALEEGDELAFVTAIESAAKTSGVEHKLTLDTTGQKVVSTWERFIPVTISASGSYPHLLAFLDELERMPYLFDIDRLSVSGSDNRVEGETVVKLDVSGITYWLGKSAPDFVHGRADAISTDSVLPAEAEEEEAVTPESNTP